MEAEINVVNGRSFIDYPSSHKRFHGSSMSAVEYYSSLQMTRTVYLITWIYSSLAMPMQLDKERWFSRIRTKTACSTMHRSIFNFIWKLPPYGLVVNLRRSNNVRTPEWGIRVGYCVREMLLSASVYFSLFLQRISKTELSQLARPTNSVDAVVRIVSLPSDMTVHCVASRNIDPEVTMRSAWSLPLYSSMTMNLIGRVPRHSNRLPSSHLQVGRLQSRAHPSCIYYLYLIIWPTNGASTFALKA